jgi:hypothetical protein
MTKVFWRYAVVMSLAIGLGIGIAYSAKYALICLSLVILICVIIARPRWSIPLFMISTWTVFPSFVPSFVVIEHHQVYLDELLIVFPLIYAWRFGRPSSYANIRVLVFGMAILISLSIGVDHLGFSNYVDTDFRGLAMLLLAFWIASRVAGMPESRIYLRVLKWILWWSATITVVSSATGFAINATTSDPVLHSDLVTSTASTVATDSTRFQTIATPLALVVLCGGIALIVAGRLTLKAIAPYLIPAMVISFLSFSRNVVLGIAVALVFVVVTDRFAMGIGRAIRRVIGGILIVAVLLLMISLGLAGGWLHNQLSAYDGRVVHGLSPSEQSTDSSVLYRQTENRALLSAIGASPILGHGFGYEYKAPYGDPGSFTATDGTIYAHDFYLWDTAKTGILGLLAFIYLGITPLRRSRRIGSAGLAIGAAAAAILVVSYVAPFPEDPASGAPLVGALIGCLACTSWLTNSEQERPNLSIDRVSQV